MNQHLGWSLSAAKMGCYTVIKFSLPLQEKEPELMASLQVGQLMRKGLAVGGKEQLGAGLDWKGWRGKREHRTRLSLGLEVRVLCFSFKDPKARDAFFPLGALNGPRRLPIISHIHFWAGDAQLDLHHLQPWKKNGGKTRQIMVHLPFCWLLTINSLFYFLLKKMISIVW